MKAELYKRLFKAIYTEDIVSLKKIAITIIQEERKLGHNVLADSLEKLTITEKPNILYLIAAEMKQDWLHCLKANGIIHSWFLIFLANS